ncbi:MAG: hypothetical protein H7X93_14285 [Sphingomonadaceae bacterium]|nr:hypothetical protein [Sphingomonadaceae bacterium]
MTRYRIAFAAALTLALTTACSREDGPAPSENVTSEPKEAVEAPGDDDRAEPATLGAEGWGPLRIGMSLDEVTAAIGADAQPDAFGDPAECDEYRPARAPAGLFVMIEENRLTRISLSDESDIATREGIRVGDPAGAVTRAYGDRVHDSPHEYVGPQGRYLTVWTTGDTPAPYVEDEAARGIRYETDETRTVRTIHAGGPSIQYVEGCL